MAVYKGGGYVRKGVVYQGPTRPKGRPSGTRKKLTIVAETSTPKPVPAKVKNYVKKAINREIETKTAALSVFNQQSTLGYGLNSTTNLGLTQTNSIIPLLLQSDEQNGRVGNKVRPTGLYLRYSLRAIQATNAGVNDNPLMPFLCRIVAYSKKISRTDSTNVGILQQGNTSVNFGSAPETWLEPYNKDMFNIHYSKQFMMVPHRRVTGQTAPNQYAQDAVVEGAKSFVMKKVKLKGIPKTFIYDDQAGTIGLANRPTNCSVYLAVCVCNVDGTAGGSLISDQRVQVNADTFLYYKDA